MNKSIMNMKSFFFVILLLGFFSACTPPLAFDPKLVEQQEAIKFNAEKPEVFTLKNGLKVMLIENNELPLVSVNLYLKGGFLNVAGTNPHQLNAMGTQMRLGGAGNYTPDELDLLLDNLAAGIDSSYGGESGGASFSSLASDFEQVFGLFADVVLRPKFDPSRLDLFKQQQLDGIRRRQDDPDTIASIALKEILFDQTVLGSIATTSDVNAIQRLDLLRLHRQFVRPNDAILAVSGAVSRERLENAANKFFAEWRPRTDRLPAINSLTHPAKQGIFFIEKPITQATIVIGRRGPARHTKDQFAISVFNSIFGSGNFSTRLMSLIRVKLGYAYSTYGAIETGPLAGRNLIYMQTKSKSTGPAFFESLKLLENLKEELVPDSEIAPIKRAIANSFVFSVDSPSKVVNRITVQQLLGYSSDFDDHYLDNINQVSDEDIRQVAKTRWSNDDFAAIVVGNSEAYESLSKALEQDQILGKKFAIKKIGFDEKVIW